MLRSTLRRLAIGTYTLFMMEQKHNPSLKGLPVSQRGKLTAKLYKNLSASDRAALEKRAQAMPSLKRNTKEKKPKTDATGAKIKRAPSQYALFVKANLSKFENLPQRERMSAVGKLWKTQQAKAPAASGAKSAAAATTAPRKPIKPTKPQK